MASRRSVGQVLFHRIGVPIDVTLARLAMLALGLSLGCAPADDRSSPVDPATLNAAVDTLLSR